MPAVRLALSQFRPDKGEYTKNVERMGGVLVQAGKLDRKPDLVAFPETATSGYFVEGGVKEVAVTAGTLARDLHVLYQGPPLDVAVGFYERFQNHIYNSGLYVTLGGQKPVVRHVHRKVFLPTYGMFDEERFVDRGQEGVRAFDTSWGGRAAILICEDAWHSLAGTIAALEGAQLLIVPSASPGRGSGAADDGSPLPLSVVRWERIVRGIAEEHGLFVALANLVGFEGGKGFPGASAVIDPMGNVLVRGPLFEEALITAELDLELLTHARADSPLLADLQSALPILTKGLGPGARGLGKSKVKFDPAANGAQRASLVPRPQAPVPVAGKGREEGDPLAIDPELTRKWLVSFLRDEVTRRRGFTKGIVGLSGGVDSSLTAFLAAEALGKDNVIGEPREPVPCPAGDRHSRHPVAHGGHQRGRGRLPEAARRRRSASPRQRDGAPAHDRVVRSLGEAQGAAARDGEQVGAPARLFHLARRRRPAGQPAGRSVQDAGVGAGAPRGRAGGDSLQTRHPGPGPRPAHRAGLRLHLRAGRSHPLLSDPRLRARGDRGARVRSGRGRGGAAAARLHPLETPAPHRRRAVADGDRPS